ncbi:MAG: DUF4364 family protein [Oscillospiraceae bacterium]|nr:DUF4364 family protein [Oscillospiraceae bacterium]MCD8256777.1 DUF4364 family protein [Oscillospiraceae bacterium]
MESSLYQDGAARVMRRYSPKCLREVWDMEPRFGFIHEKFDIKLLILFVLRHLPAEIDAERLAELVLIDGGVDYFEYKQCLAELVNTAQVEALEDGCSLTAKGARNCEILEKSLPYSVRAKAERILAPVVEEMRRSELVLANHEVGENGVTVYLSMSDGIGNIFDLKILVADETQAKTMERSFRRDAEGIYHRFVAALTEQK